MHKARYVPAILFTQTVLMSVWADAQVVLSAVGDLVTVALPKGCNSVLLSNNGAAAVDEEGNIGIEYDGLWGESSFNVGRLTPTLIGATGVCAP